jgi:putative polyketide hydroxylase
MIPVLIVGAGPVGLSIALALARQGIASKVIERNSNLSEHPKARGVNVRTMELFRQWGVEDELLQYEQPKEARRFIWAESFQGEEIARINIDDDDVALYSPSQSSLVSQDIVERVLFNNLKKYSQVEVLFSTELISFVQDKNGVVAHLKNAKTGKSEQLTAQYLVGADGLRSTVRESLGIAMTEPQALGQFCGVYCEIDLSLYLKTRPCIAFLFTDIARSSRSFFTIDGKKKWIFGMRFSKENTSDDFTDEYCIEEVRRVVGEPDFPVKILKKSFWTMGKGVAEKFREGKVFLAGDSAHQIPPTGGLGMNTGVQDAHNLAWKLAWILKYPISETLLQTYSEERRPIAERNIEWSCQNAKRYVEIGAAIQAGDKEKLRQKLQEQHQNLNHRGLELGFIYQSSCVCNENDDVLSVSASEYLPTTLPGSRAPHVELIKDGKTISTLDLFETTFVLLLGGDAEMGRTIIEAMHLPVPLTCYRIAFDGDLQELIEGSWAKIYQIESTQAVLVRPDGHVAWRGKVEKDNLSEVFAKIIQLKS